MPIPVRPHSNVPLVPALAGMALFGVMVGLMRWIRGSTADRKARLRALPILEVEVTRETPGRTARLLGALLAAMFAFLAVVLLIGAQVSEEAFVWVAALGVPVLLPASVPFLWLASRLDDRATLRIDGAGLALTPQNHPDFAVKWGEPFQIDGEEYLQTSSNPHYKQVTFRVSDKDGRVVRFSYAGERDHQVPGGGFPRGDADGGQGAWALGEAGEVVLERLRALGRSIASP